MWAVGDAYGAYVGRWSRPVAVAFPRWLDLPADGNWLDAGCGTGALAATVLATTDPARIVGVDTSEMFLTTARARISDPRATFLAGDAQSLPDHRFDAVVSGLALNFVRVTKRGGTTAAYVWNYARGMAVIRHFWDAAACLDPVASELDEGRRFPICEPVVLQQLWTDAGLGEVTVRAIEVPTVFTDCDGSRANLRAFRARRVPDRSARTRGGCGSRAHDSLTGDSLCRD